MPAKWKKKYKAERRKFKEELKLVFKYDLSFAYAIWATCLANRHRKYIHGLHYRLSDVILTNKEHRAYTGKMLCGEETVSDAIRLCYPNFSNYRIPERLKMGDAYGLAVKRLNQRVRNLNNANQN